MAVAEGSDLFEGIHELGDLGEAYLEEISQFWIEYAALRGVRFEVLDLSGPRRAAELVDEHHR